MKLPLIFIIFCLHSLITLGVYGQHDSLLKEVLGRTSPSFWGPKAEHKMAMLAIRREGDTIVIQGNFLQNDPKPAILKPLRVAEGILWSRVEKRGTLDHIREGKEVGIWEDAEEGGLRIGRSAASNKLLVPVELGAAWALATWRLGKHGEHFLIVMEKDLHRLKDMTREEVSAWSKERLSREEHVCNFWLMSDYGQLKGNVFVKQSKDAKSPDSVEFHFERDGGQFWQWQAEPYQISAQARIKSEGKAGHISAHAALMGMPESHTPDAPEFKTLRARMERQWAQLRKNQEIVPLPPLEMPLPQLFACLQEPGPDFQRAVTSLRDTKIPALGFSKTFTQLYPKKGQFSSAAE